MIVPLPEGEVTWDTDSVRRKLVEQLEFDEARHRKEIEDLFREIEEGLGVSKAVIFYSEWWQALKKKYLKKLKRASHK